MRTCHRTLLPAALLLFIAIAVLPASAFYNPNTGTWLSRDPIEERGGLHLYAFVRNATTFLFDALGRIVIAPVGRSYDGIPEEYAGTGEELAVTVSEVDFRIPDHESCGFLYFGERLKPLEIHLNQFQYFASEAAAAFRMASGRTVQAHEDAHLANSQRTYTDVENHVNGWGRKCLCRPICKTLRDDIVYYGAYSFIFYGALRDANEDLADYPSDKKSIAQNKYDTALSSYNYYYQFYTEALAKWNRFCQ